MTKEEALQTLINYAKVMVEDGRGGTLLAEAVKITEENK